MIRWERKEDGSWNGLSGELLVATLIKEAEDRWNWNITAIKRPKGWRKGTGHRTEWLQARAAAEEYWERWISAAALRPDIGQLASQSLAAEARPKRRLREKKRRSAS